MGELSERPRRLYEQLVETATDPLFVVRDGEFAVANGEFLDLVGYERSALVGRAVTDVLPEDAERDWRRQVNLLRAEGETDSDRWDSRLVTRRGVGVPVTLELSVVTTAAGESAGLAGRATDRRARRRREQRLNVLNRVLRHNIRNRMNLILGHADRLQGVEDEGYRTLAERITEVGEEIVTLSDKARKAHERLGVPDDVECRLDLAGVTERVVRSFRISHPDAAVTTALPETAPARAPPSYEVALTELLENAVVHHDGEGGPVTVAVDAGSERVRVHVRDECPPIPDAVVDCLEEGWEQPLEHNEGMGLWLVQWVAETVEADLSFDRRPDGTGNEVTLGFEALAE